MGLLNNILDRFNKAEFSVAPNKKLKTLSKEFLDSFELNLVFYKGKMIADGDMTLAALDKRTSKKTDTKGAPVKITGSMKVGDAEQLFDKQFGVTVQIKNKAGNKLVPNEITIGQASREEY